MKYIVGLRSGNRLEIDMDGTIPDTVFAGRALAINGMLINIANIEYIAPVKGTSGVIKPISPEDIQDKQKKEIEEYKRSPEKIIAGNKKRLRDETPDIE